MMTYKFTPRFNDTDALGHINNAAIVTWFECGREETFRLFTPDLDPKKWALILARLEVDYLLPGNYGKDVVVESEIAHIGNTSFSLAQQIFQAGQLIAKCRAVLVHYNYELGRKQELPFDVKEKLKKHLIE